MFKNIIRNTSIILGFGLLFSFSSHAEGFSKGKVKLPFEISSKIEKSDLTQKSKTNVLVNFKIDSGSYLYKDSISIKFNSINGLKVGSFKLPKAEKKLDKFTNTQKEIYHNSFSVLVPIEVTEKVNTGKLSFSSIIGYQGCSSTICYIPQEKTINLTANVKKK